MNIRHILAAGATLLILKVGGFEAINLVMIGALWFAAFIEYHDKKVKAEKAEIRKKRRAEKEARRNEA